MEENEKPPVFLEPPPRAQDIETILIQLTTGPGRDIGKEFNGITTGDFPRRTIEIE